MMIANPVTVLAEKTEEREARNIPLSRSKLHATRAAYSTRRIPQDKMLSLLTGHLKPRAGDLLLARVERVGQHKHIELPSGRRARLYVGDEVLVCYGNRYAPDQFEAVVPHHLGACDLVAAGGVAAQTLSRHSGMKRPTVLCPQGLVADGEGGPLNLAAWALPRREPRGVRPYTIAVMGTAMNAGKTTTAAGLIHGLSKFGFGVGAAKVTGTGAGGDRWSMVDAGAKEVLDFTDAGFVSTYRLSVAQVEGILASLTSHLAYNGAEVIVLEIADGLFQEETAGLSKSSSFRALVDAVIFAAGDAMGAAAGVAWLCQLNLPVIAVSGLLTLSPLAVREATAATGLPVLTRETLCKGRWQAGVLRSSGQRPRNELSRKPKRTKPKALWPLLKSDSTRHGMVSIPTHPQDA